MVDLVQTLTNAYHEGDLASVKSIIREADKQSVKRIHRTTLKRWLRDLCDEDLANRRRRYMLATVDPALLEAYKQKDSRKARSLIERLTDQQLSDLAEIAELRGEEWSWFSRLLTHIEWQQLSAKGDRLRIVEHLAYRWRADNQCVAKKKVAELVSQAITDGKLPKRTKGKFVIAVLSEIERQKRLRDKRTLRKPDSEPASLIETLWRRYQWFERLDGVNRKLKNCPLYQKLQVFFQRTCCACPTGLVTCEWRSSAIVANYRVYDGKKYCEKCYGVIAEIDQPNSKPQVVDILAALFALNRQAKRYRDLSQELYRQRRYGLATCFSMKKLAMYSLKGQAIHYLLKEGRLRHVGFHRFGSNYAEVLSGAGYRFHRPVPPPELNEDIPEIETIEAKPKDVSEPDFVDGLYSVRVYLECRPKIETYDWPSRSRQSYWYDDDDWDE